ELIGKLRVHLMAEGDLAGARYFGGALGLDVGGLLPVEPLGAAVCLDRLFKDGPRPVVGPRAGEEDHERADSSGRGDERAQVSPPLSSEHWKGAVVPAP